ncbi:MAG: hypothetical protein HYX25_08150 [Candidatus Solibacter usitatus]|nr:hypothetical protein [Candidatus Solibacter usitatus]
MKPPTYVTMKTRLGVTLVVTALALAAQPATYLIETVAGSSAMGDGGPAIAASLNNAQGIAVDPAGNIFIADTDAHRIRKITPDGLISTVAGTGAPGAQGDGGPAVAAQLNTPYGVAADRAGNLYIADLGNNRVRCVTPDGLIRTLAADAPGGWLAPRNIAVDAAGNIYVAEFAGHRIRKIAHSGVVTIVAGTGIAGFSGDSRPAGTAQFAYPAGLAFDPQGNLYIADSGNNRVRKIIASSWQITTVLGTGVPGASELRQLTLPTGVALDSSGTLYVADSGNRRIRGVSPAGQVSSVPGAGRDVAVDANGNLYIASANTVLQVIPGADPIIIAGGDAGSFGGDGGPAINARLAGPAGLAITASGEIYIADSRNHRVRKVDANGFIGTAAGNGTPGQDAGQLNYPKGLAWDPAGTLYIADQNNDRVEQLTPHGAMNTVAGAGIPGFNGDGLPAISTQLLSPAAVALAGDGALIVADGGNGRVRLLSAAGTLLTIASQVDSRGVAADRFGTVYIADTPNHRILSVDPGGAAILFAGTGVAGFSGDGAEARAAQLNQPTGLAIDALGNLFIADTGNHCVRVVSAAGVIATIAGTGNAGSSGDGGPALLAQLNSPAAVAVDATGSVWIADTGNDRIRKLSPGVVAPPPAQVLPLAVVNGASWLAGAVAPGEIVSIFSSGGAALGPDLGVAAASALPTQLAEAEVRFDGQPARLYYVQANQINAQAPASITVRTQVEVFYQGVSRGQAQIAVTGAMPGIFVVSDGAGQAVVIHADGSLNSATNPAARGSIVTFYATGQGQNLPLLLTLNGFPAEILSATDAAGLLRIDARLPSGFAPAGVLQLELAAGTASSQPGVTIAVR